MKSTTIDVNTVVKDIVLKVTIFGLRKFKIKLFLAKWLIKLAAWILNCKMEFEVKEI